MCYNIPTEVILANLFHYYKGELTISQIRRYIDFLQERMDKYVWTTFCEKEVRDVVELYPKLYRLREDGINLAVISDDIAPNLDYFNSRYHDSVRNYLERITRIYLAEEIKN